MAGSYAYDGTLLDVAGQGVAVDGDWFEVLSGGSSERSRGTVQVLVSMTAGTGTWVLEGRNGPNDSPTQLDTGTASKTGSYFRMAQMRLRWTAAAGLTARGSVSATLKNVTYTPFFSTPRVDGVGYGTTVQSAVDAVVSQIGNSRIDAFAVPILSPPVMDGAPRVRFVPDVRGSGPWQLFSGGTELGLTGSGNPAYDAATGTITTDFSSTLALAASATNSLRGQDKWVVVIGALNPGIASSCLGWLCASDFSKYASLQGDASGQLMALLAYQSGGTSTIFSGQAPGTTMGMWIFEHPQPIGADTARALYVPRIQAEWYGRGARRLVISQGGTYVLPPAGSYHVHCGGRFFNGGSNAADTRVRAIICGSGFLTASDKFALYKLALTLNVQCVAPRPLSLLIAGDSRPQGVGSTDPTTQSFAARLQFYMDALMPGKVDVVNHSIPGMWMQEIEQQKHFLLQAQASPLRKTILLLQAGINDAHVAALRTAMQVGDDAESIGAACSSSGILPVLFGEIAPMIQANRDILYTRHTATLKRGNAWAVNKLDNRPAFQVAVNQPAGEYYDQLHLYDTGQDHEASDTKDVLVANGVQLLV